MTDTATVPLVSCIMPTYNRRAFIPHAIRYFLRQDYVNKELIIIDDGTDSIEDLVPESSSIRYYRLDKKITLGAKLNLACSYASGNVVVHWDDDDWYAARRIKYQVETLQKEGTDICGLNNLLYFDSRNNKSYNYIYPKSQRLWIIGSSFCYNRECWSKNHFADINVGMDGLFVWKLRPDQVSVNTDNSISVHMIHDNNISPKKTGGAWWHQYPLEGINKVMGNDLNMYNNNPDVGYQPESSEVNVPDMNTNGWNKQIKNVYACLVHENADCVIDLVKNLSYNDPCSTILLYNGGEDKNLMLNDFSFANYGAVIHPSPKPMHHGYLHNFALDCMRFSLDKFSFDTLTIVDSDQLAIQPGYTDYLGKFLSSRQNVGMLSSDAAIVTQDNVQNLIAAQAYKEYELWKPLLHSFPGGETKFVHWTFWPATVFTYAAIKDLLKLFRENVLLHHIMQHTKIWATEEVIFPTLIRLLGYQIVTNPCSYDYVRYRKTPGLHDIEQALKQKAVYWMHPIKRNYDDPVRARIRGRFHQYTSGNEKLISGKESLFRDTGAVQSLIRKISRIEGWLSEDEAGLLISSTLDALEMLPSPFVIVETGSYHGKSTVLFGSIINSFSTDAIIYSIDPHDGRLGAEDKGIQVFPSSFEMFKANIEIAGIAGVVNVIRDNPVNLRWDRPVSFLFIDGLHDYSNVKKDFGNFSEWLVPGAYVAFHDYAIYFPGVIHFVDELSISKSYKKIRQADSLVILQKLQ